MDKHQLQLTNVLTATLKDAATLKDLDLRH